MADLVQWLRAQLNEDEAAAEDTLSLHVRVGRFRGVDVQRWRITKSGAGIIDEDGGTLRAQQIFPAEAAHVIRHDPARVLREVEAKRGVVAAYLPPGEDPHPGQPCINYDGQDPDEYDDYDSCSRHLEANKRLLRHDYVLRLLALPYADRDGYQEGWAP